MSTTPLFYGTVLAIIDVIVFSALELKSQSLFPVSSLILPLAFALYGSQALIFYKSLQYSNMIIVNMIWNVLSNVLVVIFGLYYFNFHLTAKEISGLVLGFISIFLLS
jgi:hypothetical protein